MLSSTQVTTYTPVDFFRRFGSQARISNGHANDFVASNIKSDAFLGFAWPLKVLDGFFFRQHLCCESVDGAERIVPFFQHEHKSIGRMVLCSFRATQTTSLYAGIFNIIKASIEGCDVMK